VEPLSESCLVSPAGTGLTGGAHRSNRCWSVDSRFGVPIRSWVGRVCVLVPRSSGTPVATWSWPTWVVSRRRVLEVVFILLEFPSPSRRIFIGSHSVPPLWFAVSVLQYVTTGIHGFAEGVVALGTGRILLGTECAERELSATATWHCWAGKGLCAESLGKTPRHTCAERSGGSRQRLLQKN
jgi:hypothetical protein